jgi:hypothetical protein
MISRLRGVRGFVAGVLVASVVGAGGLAVVRATSGSSSASSYVPVAPVRVLDTRSDLGLVAVTDGVAGTLKVTGSIPTATSTGVVNAVVVPSGATAVVLNVTAVNPTAGGYVSLRPGDATGAPTVSTLNVTAGGTFPNGATITVPTMGAHAGEIQVWYEAEGTTVGSTELLIDIAGYYELASAGPQGEPGVDATVAITQLSVCDGTDAGTVANELCKIGMTGPGGGLIFFVDYNDQYASFCATGDCIYLEASPANATSGAWCSDTSTGLGLTGWDKSAVGAGRTNTTTADTTCTTGAVQTAVDYTAPSFNGVAKDDWWLGSIGEMMLMYTNLRQAGVGGFSPDGYWSSSESDVSLAWYQNFYLGTQPNDSKDSTYYVRPVRAF